MHCHPDAPVIDPDAPYVLVGNPNVGKSVVFGALTGRYAEVSNFPGTTVEITSGRLGDTPVIDTPGIQSLLARSDDERVTRDILLSRPARAVVQVINASELRRGLLMTLQLAELGVPLVLDLNMIDEARTRGISLDAGRLSQALDVEVAETIATRREGLGRLEESMHRARRMGYQIHYDAAIEQAVEAISRFLPADHPAKRGLSLMLLAGDESLVEMVPAKKRGALAAIIRETASCFDHPLSYEIARQRLTCADCLLAGIVDKRGARSGGFAAWLGRMSVHPVWGWPLLALVLLALYLFVGQLGAGVLVGLIEGTVFGEWITPAAAALIEPLGVPFLTDLLVGEYGIISMALAYGLAIVMPIVLTFFIAFSMLEDSGYLPRLAVMLDRPFKAMGLNGKAVLPMVLGLGCDTMATLTTRIMDTKRDRVLVTLLLALGVPCSAQLGVLMGMVALLPLGGTAIWAAVIIGVLFAVGWLASKVLPGKPSAFILELPPIRAPQPMNILIKTLARLEWYLKEVLPLFVIGTLALFGLDRTGALGWLEQAASPLIVNGLGLPAETTGAFIIGFLRRDYGAAGLFSLARSGALTPAQLVVSLVVVTLFVPCIANVLIIVKEHGIKTAAGVVGVVFPLAFGVGAALNSLFQAIGARF